MGRWEEIKEELKEELGEECYQEGLEEGIRGAIEILREIDMDPREIEKRISQKYDVPEEAIEFIAPSTPITRRHVIETDEGVERLLALLNGNSINGK